MRGAEEGGERKLARDMEHAELHNRGCWFVRWATLKLPENK